MRFYPGAGDGMHWLTAVPCAIVRACLVMMPRLEAEESLLQADRVGIGTGSFEKSTARRILQRWDELRRGPAPAAKKATPAALAGAGIGHRTVKGRT